MTKKTKILTGILIGMQAILLISVAGVFLQNNALADMLEQLYASQGEEIRQW